MALRSIELKATCTNVQAISEFLEKHGSYKGRDHQVDTYFQVPHGRLKLRQGTIENNLIAYHRPDVAAQKLSEVSLYQPVDPEGLKQVLQQALPVLVIVDKYRHIYFIDNVKFHIDEVTGLGHFVEIEAIDESGRHSDAELERQCQYYQNKLGILPEDLCSHSYSDMLLNR
ncbi:MAG TPA: class IV adenylate cyclase [Saprospiraceae bacterium]|nr:class IV adenylate cyclase [Saprospiraceae bacterium]MCB9269614.1 class IV adenylate cyclase [Lewinellaceae bacterium]HPR01041.1 class IV adenylate cyclase [Saprospiraceae bacterium]HRV84056.1 class IV adenylate cyclase [Saprospiraceae bacterium]